MQRNLRAWFLGRLDSLLAEEQRRLPPAELSRLRVLAGAAALSFVLALANAFGPEAPAHGTLFRAVMWIFAAAYMGVLVMVRRGASLQRAALLLCTTLTVGTMLNIILVQLPLGQTHALIMLTPALAVYLLGARLGFIFTALMVLYVLVLHPLFSLLFLQGGVPGGQLLTPEQQRLSVAVATLSLLSGWFLSWLHSSAREEAHAALEESEGRLVSLIESTDDLVCSFNAEGRILTANQAVRRLLRQGASGEPTESASLIGLLQPEVWEGQLARAFAGQHQRFEVSASLEGKPRVLDLSLNPIFRGEGRPVGVTLFGRDITARKQAEARLEEMHRSLLDVSRQAGKAEVAVGVLHNIGNTLNSVTVSTALVAERARGLRVAGVAKVAALLRENAGDLGTFFTAAPRGRKLPAFFQTFSEYLSEEQAALVKEAEVLGQGVEHLRAVVSIQQEHARAAGIIEQVAVAQLINDALRLQGAAFEQQGIQVRTEYAPVPLVLLDRHKLLQILINLLSNACHSLVESARPDKQLLIRVGPTPTGQ
ncbi:MAG: PAS domain-containing protein, partial [Myxococcaceae bacterium]|nr:PAS domain-containing protein [Myxococcaceae bacterium]